MKRPAVFLDRDGTMIRDVGYLRRLEDLAWYPWTIDAVRLLNRAGFLVCVATNQGGIGLGLLDLTFVFETHRRMQADLKAGGAHVDGWYVCPHHPRSQLEAFSVECACRKPKPGLIRQAEAEFAIDMTRSFVVGDKAQDIELAEAAGVRGVLVRTGEGMNELLRTGGIVPGAAHISDHLMEATAWILRQDRDAKGTR